MGLNYSNFLNTDNFALHVVEIGRSHSMKIDNSSI